MRGVARVGLGVAAGCDSLVGGAGVDQRIGGPALPPDAVWEVRWVGERGLELDCERVDAGLPDDAVAVFGVVEAPLPVLTPPVRVEADGFSFALALPALTWADAAFPEVGEPSLHDELGVWGAAAPTAWLSVTGSLESASIMTIDGSVPPAEGWVEVVPEVVWATGGLSGALFPLDPVFLEDGVEVTALDYLDDDLVAVWAGEPLGGIAASCP